ncbi:MAG: DUF5060 domain-containing protein [Gammaproteobacteria bacterium]
MRIFTPIVFLVVCILSPQTANADNFTAGSQTGRLYGVHEISVESGSYSNVNPFDVICQIEFTSPSRKSIKVKAFYDGDRVWKARLYVTEVGQWTWDSSSPVNELDKKGGSFDAITSSLRGKLRKHDDDPKQWMTDNGKWFLNLSDTAYRLFNKEVTAAQFERYVMDVSNLGFTSVRAGGLGGWDWGKRSVVMGSENQNSSNWPWEGDDKTRYDLEKFQTTDERLIFLLNNYPELYVQLILFGLVEWATPRHGETWDAIPESTKANTMAYMLARWAAFPQVFWLIVNDLDVRPEFPKNRSFCRNVGNFLTKNDLWKSLVSCGPIREQLYPFVSKEDQQWSTYIHIENDYNVSASYADEYASIPVHVFAGEDRYEHDYVDKEPMFPQYYYRRLFWSWLLSGGSANYAGRYPYIHPYTQTGKLPAVVQGARYDRKLVGADSIKHIKPFFAKHDISLDGWRSCDNIVYKASGVFSKIEGFFKKDSRRVKCIKSESSKNILLYHPNAQDGFEEEGFGADRRINVNTERTAELWIKLPPVGGSFDVIWLRAENGEIRNGEQLNDNQEAHMKAPWRGSDVLLYLSKSSL